MIFLVGGIKGGVGKSTISLALFYYLTAEISQEPLVIDSDRANPDVYKAIKNCADHDRFDVQKVINLPIDTPDDWIAAIDLIERTDRQVPIIINTHAGGKEALLEYGQTLDEVLDELGRTLITYWPINAQRDCLELLKEYLEIFPTRKVHVLKNGFCGREHQFELYDSAKNLPNQIKERGGGSYWLPVLASRVANLAYTDRRTFNYLARNMPIGSRAELKRWLAKTNAIFKLSLGEVEPEGSEKAEPDAGKIGSKAAGGKASAAEKDS